LVYPLTILTPILEVITAIIIVGVALLAITNAIFFKIGVRNIPRRRTQMLLIVFALMLSTTLLSSVLTTGDVITAAALAITGTPAVIERRQQIGMLRALGCKRRFIQGAFLSESFFVGCTIF
jgi:hypothetical protein